MTARPFRYLLRTARVAAIIAQHHLCHEGFADEIGVCRQHWSGIFNRRRTLSPTVRRALLGNPRLAGIPEAELFEVFPASLAA